jgi:pyruvate/2-oxoglutarate dehydrogenase complex dihydrolipoamide dehydrogenase (E3) component
VFRDRHVTIIGAGQSALESAALLHEHGAEVHVLVRAPQLAWNDDPGPEETSRLDRLRCPTAPLCGCGWKCLFYSYGAGAFHYLPHRTRVATVKQTFGPAGAWWLKPRVLGQVDIHLQTTVTRATAKNGQVALEVDDAMTGRRNLETDHVLAATGYHVNVDAIGFIDPNLRTAVRTIGGVPKLTRSFESSVPGLYFVGLAAAHEFGPAMRFVYGADFAARRVVRRLARVTTRNAASAPTTGSAAPASRSA